MLYQDRIKRVCEHIERHLDEDLSLHELSNIAALSKYHFHRVFHAIKGLTLFNYVNMSRLKRASYQLAFSKNIRITDIALDAGYETPEAFSRSFKRLFGQSPSQFRKTPNWHKWESSLSALIKKGEADMDVKIVNFPETKVAKLTHKGSAKLVMESVAKFIEWRKSTGLSPVNTSCSFGIPYADPDTVAEEDFVFDICGSVIKDIPENPFGVINSSIPGGKCAVVRHKGSLDNVADTIYALYREWLPESGEELRDFPCFFQYLNLVPMVDECELETDVLLPLK